MLTYIRVRLLVNHRLGKIGDVVSMPAIQADALVKANRAEYVKTGA